MMRLSYEEDLLCEQKLAWMASFFSRQKPEAELHTINDAVNMSKWPKTKNDYWQIVLANLEGSSKFS